MAERASLLQSVQIGVESTSGTAVAANKRLLGTSIELGISANIRTFRPMGQKFATLAALGKEWAEGDLSGQLCYGDITYLLAGNQAYAAPAQQAATAAYKWTLTPAQAAADTLKTYTIEAGGAVRAHKAAFGMVDNLGYTINREEATIKGSVMGRAITDGISMTGSPTDIALKPVLATQVDVTMDSAGAGLGTTKLTRVLRVDWESGKRFNPVWAVDSAQTSWVDYVEVEPTPKFKLLVEADAAGMALLTSMRAGTKQFFRVKATGDLIASTYYYVFQHDLCGVVSDVTKFRDEDGVYAIEWTFDITYDSTWAKAQEFQVTNTLTAL